MFVLGRGLGRGVGGEGGCRCQEGDETPPGLSSGPDKETRSWGKMGGEDSYSRKERVRNTKPKIV